MEAVCSKFMHSDNTNRMDSDITIEKPDEWWYKIYFAVMITTIVVISALYAFTHYFSS